MATGFEYVYAYGDTRVAVRLPLDADSANITVGMAITSSGATAGYYKEVDASGESVVGIAMEEKDSPSTDGGASVLVDISESSYYRVNPDTGTVSAALRLKTADIGADGKSVNIDASATDNVKIHDVRTDDNTMLVSLIVETYAGVA
tara:strand:- start:1136 stop:1576 length:441 start_codon:yes stop_codon:yes gene_type:complete